MNFDSEVDAARVVKFFDEDVSDFLKGSELDFDDEQHLLWTEFDRPHFTELGQQIIIDDVIENYPTWEITQQLDHQGRPTGHVIRTASSFSREWVGMIITTVPRLRGNWGGSRHNFVKSTQQIPILFGKPPEEWLSEEKQRVKGYVEENYLDRQWNKLRFIYVFFQLYITRHMSRLIHRPDNDTGSISYDILYEFRLLIDRISYWNYFPWEVLLLTDTIDSILLAMNNINNQIGMMRTPGSSLNHIRQTHKEDFLLLRQMEFAGQQNYFAFKILQLYYFNNSTDRNYFTEHGVKVANRFDLTIICEQLRSRQGVPYFLMVDEYPQHLLLTDHPQHSVSVIPANSPLNTQSLLTQSVFKIMFSSNGIPVNDLMAGLQRLRNEPPNLLYGFFLTMLNQTLSPEELLFLHRVAEGEVWRFSNILSPPPSESSDMSLDETPEDGDLSQPTQPAETPQSTMVTGEGSSSSRTARLSPAQTKVVSNILLRFGSNEDRIASWMVNPQKTILMVEQRPASIFGPTQNYWIDLNTLLVYNNPEMKKSVGNVSGEGVRRGLFRGRGGKRKKKTRRKNKRKKKTKRRRKKKKKTRRRR